jgi:hypothetical protein
MSERIVLSLSPTGSNPAGTARITPELLAFHYRRAHALRAEAIACFARGFWLWVVGRAPARRIGECAGQDWQASPARG